MLFLRLVKFAAVLFLHADGAYRAGVGGVHRLGHFLRRDGAGLGHGQHALHVEYGGAQPGALGAADAQVRVNECDHKICLLRMMSVASMGGFGAKYARHLRAAVVE